jgi:hypothetical protein
MFSNCLPSVVAFPLELGPRSVCGLFFSAVHVAAQPISHLAQQVGVPDAIRQYRAPAAPGHDPQNVGAALRRAFGVRRRGFTNGGDGADSLIGWSKLAVETCLGAPVHESSFGDSDILTYGATSTDSHMVSIGLPFAIGITISGGGYCSAIVRLQGGRVAEVRYIGETNAFLMASDAYAHRSCAVASSTRRTSGLRAARPRPSTRISTPRSSKGSYVFSLRPPEVQLIGGSPLPPQRRHFAGGNHPALSPEILSFGRTERRRSGPASPRGRAPPSRKRDRARRRHRSARRAAAVRRRRA